MSRTSDWLTPLRIAVLAVLATAAGTLTYLNHTGTYRQFLQQAEEAFPMSAALSADAIYDWLSAREAQAAFVAAIAARSATATAASEALSGSLREIAIRGGLLSAVVLDSTTPPPRLRARVLDDSLSVIDVFAPITRDGRTFGWVVLSVVANEVAFSHFNVAATTDRTQRTSLLMFASDSIVPLTSSTAGGGPRTSNGLRSIPVGFQLDSAARRTLRVSGLTPTHGIATGLYGKTVVYARAPVPGTPWILVRERDVTELTGLIRGSVIVTDAIFIALAALILGVLSMSWRAAFMRREHQAMALRSAFVSNVSHELRTPLTQIRLYAEMLRHGLLEAPTESARALRVIEREAERLSVLVERALAFARAGAAPPEDAAPVIRLADAVRDAVASVGALAAERGDTVTVDVPPHLQARIARDALHQVLLNLLDNAIKYGPSGQHIRVAATTSARGTRITIADQGPGIPAAEREQIWQAFVRGRNAQAGSEIGSGIGLAIVRDLTTRAGGGAYVETPSGAEEMPLSGARFVVELPAVPDQDHTPSV